MKVCKDCGEKKVLTAFNQYIGKTGNKLRRGHCAVCELQQRNNYRTRDAKGRASSTIGKLKLRAKAKGFNFNLTTRWYQAKMAKGICEATGLPLDLGPATIPNWANPFSPSVDRIDNNRGYTKNNCQVVVWIYNRAKGADTDSDLLVLSRALLEG